MSFQTANANNTQAMLDGIVANAHQFKTDVHNGIAALVAAGATVAAAAAQKILDDMAGALQKVENMAAGVDEVSQLNN